MVLAPPKGNLSLVRQRTMIENYEIEMTDHALRANPTDAELVPEAQGAWYLVHAYPGDSVQAMRWLARRRFGVFQPVEQRRHKETGMLVQGWQPVFPDWLMVYTWDIDRMQTRIINTPCVMDMLCDPVSLRPVPIDEEFVQGLRELSYAYRDRAPHPSNYRFHSERHIRRRMARPSKKQRKELDRLKKEAKDIGVGWDQHTWANINALAPHERIAHLQRTLTQNKPSL
jgi:hypothetical protein